MISASEAEPCRQIWRAVLVQAARDLLFPASYKDGDKATPNPVDQRHTEAWLDSRDFRTVCALAGYEPSRVAGALRRHIAARKAGQLDLRAVGFKFGGAGFHNRRPVAKETSAAAVAA